MDDDEFGDLYSDVLQPFASSSPSPPPPISTSPLPPIQQQQKHQSPQQQQQQQQQQQIPQSLRADLNPPKESDADSVHSDVKFDIEDDAHDAGIGFDPVIPGLSSNGRGDAVGGHAEGSERIDEKGEGGDDWAGSDSDDDLQIVLNDNNLMAMERGGIVDGDGGDGDEEEGGLNIVAGGDPNQGAEEQEWGESAAQNVNGERKEVAELGKGGGGVTVAPKVGYGHQGYHPPFHSHFKVSDLVLTLQRIRQFPVLLGDLYCFTPAYVRVIVSTINYEES